MASETRQEPVDRKRLRELEEAFALFNETSRQLTEAYEALQQQLASVQARLARTEQRRRVVSERLERLLALLPAGVVLLDGQGRIVELNPAACAMLGADVVGRPWEVVERNVFLHRTPADELVMHDGRTFHTAQAGLDTGEGRLILLQDVTPARQLQEYRSRHQRLTSLGDMAASLAHQIRTPLSTAILYVSQLGQPMEEAQRAAFAEKTLTSLRHIEHLVEDMLQYARGGKAVERPVSVQALFRGLEEAMGPLVEQYPRAELRVVPPVEDVTLSGDYDALLTALQNLVHNALEAAGQSVCVEVTGEVVNNQLIIRVIDDGPGIDETVQEKIFEPFYTGRANGTGLGLAVVRAVAEAHGGEIRVHALPGVGSTFTLQLPLIQVKAE